MVNGGNICTAIWNLTLQRYIKKFKAPKIFGKKLLTYTKFLYFCIQITNFKYNKHEEDIVFIDVGLTKAEMDRLSTEQLNRRSKYLSSDEL